MGRKGLIAVREHRLNTGHNILPENLKIRDCEENGFRRMVKELSLLASAAKAKLCEVAQRATNEAIQMHGGIGITDEHEIGFFIKRARVAQHTFGDYNYHLDRFATLSGF